MKLFTRAFAVALAMTCAAAPLSAQAQSHHPDRKPSFHQSHKPQAHRPPPKHKWARGHKVSDWKRRQHVRDYRRYGLRAPGKGQQWIKVDNDYLLVSMATGLILGLAAGR
ncbi:hypothetical protein CYG48_20770 (plasmid) [Neorhizobium sp. SOG26]|jgi:Predicted integral membrane protein|uniref:RcnB family protein n=1 Tax=Neorhizobium sp. SOG26 TaxID=2060726 RepID=UPI000E576D2D|nr:RcnB family protein [Neorhizobium sp. SOG26]AXV18194.1 hypothetical protein CYG48_20770 [Neorhizobium sp. SOG26]